VATTSEPADPLRVNVHRDGHSAATVTVTGLLVRQHAARLDERLAVAFDDLRRRYVIDLGGVTCLDPTTLAAVTRRADLARRHGARVTIIPPGSGRRVAA
jgi:anti-anti-sigma regulatory factor